MKRLLFQAALTAYASAALLAQPAAPISSTTASVLAPVASLNQALPKWVRFDGEERVRLEGFAGGNFQPSSKDVFVLNRLRVGTAIEPVNWLRFRFQMQDSRVGGKAQKPYAPPFQSTFDLRQAYLEAGGGEQDGVTFRFGRQEINLGEERLIGSSGWSNCARSFDAVRLGLRKGKFRLDAFAASPVVMHDGEIGEHVPGNNLHGLYGGLQNVVPKSKIEPYLFWRLNQRLKTEAGGIGNLDFTVAGFRWIGSLPWRVDYGLEMAREQGSLGSDRISAWAGHWVVGHTVARWSGHPRVFGELNYATGDANSADGRRGTFDQLFPSGHDKWGQADQVGWKNIVHARAGIEWKPSPKWSTAGKFGSYWLADPHDALYNAAGTALARRLDGSAGRFVGTELDGVVSRSLSPRLQIGAGLGHLFAGRFLHRTTPGAGYTYPYLMLTAQL